MPLAETPSLDQHALEQLTGLSREVLRKWELRYQFPQPGRGPRGQRLYSQADAQKLHLMARLQQHGHRASKLVDLPLDALDALLAAAYTALPDETEVAQVAQRTQHLLEQLGPPIALHSLTAWLAELIKTRGLEAFAHLDLPAFNAAVGQAWQAGRLSVHAEHIYTVTLRELVLRAMPAARGAPRLPCVLLCTPPGELHSLALLALLAQLRCQGASCVDLGTQVPVAEVAAAARELDAGIVAVSISGCLAKTAARRFLTELREQLAPQVSVWLGGLGCADLPARLLSDFEVFDTTQDALLRWKRLASAQATVPA